ncbi:peptidase S10 [Alteromonas sp. C1M14]|uniref:S10 family peptidase n=1 Tax=Alteromonas sp. C1M14 TaxID=2841567 RepID=UPI001C082733|nr:peptidase S10 [Alteromonas sp. C1M14]MBU2979979.1 peptidase S10 [Alteromonas sp. C1M14]
MGQRLLVPLLCASLLSFTTANVLAASDTDKTQIQKIQEATDKQVVTQHHIKLNGKTFKYSATTGNMIIKDDDNKPSASVFYVAYTKPADKNETRPVTFVFNGGPGSSSLWLHMGSFGPKRVKTTNAAPTPTAPYTLLDNQYTLLDSTDLVFIDAFDTGLTRALSEESNDKQKSKGANPGQKFWGVDQDVDGFARFITRYVTVNQRWNSPKFLMGESYGTIRAPALANKLQESGMAMNGVVLISSILNYGADAPGLDREFVGLLPTFASVAYYHDKLPSKPAQLAPFLDEVREFAEGDYARALAKGHNLSAQEQTLIAERLHQFTGLSVKYLEHANLRVGQSQFRKELLRDEEQIVGRYDGRFTSIDKNSIGERPDTDASDTAPSPAFIAMFNDYLTTSLNYHADEPYRVFSLQAFRNWDWSHRLPHSNRKSQLPFVVDDLGNAMRTNPYLHVFSANGYYDLATPFHATEYDLAHMQLPDARKNNLEIGYYPSGHMLYLNPEALVSLHDDLEAFYQQVLTK